MRELLKDALVTLEDICLDCAIESLSNSEQKYSETFRPYRIDEAKADVKSVRDIIARIKEELDKPETTHIVWIPNTGIIPTCNLVLIKSIGGDPDVLCSPSAYDWSLNNKYPVTEYAIIEE